MNNIFPPINGHSRPPSEDLRAVGSSEIPTSTSKTNQPIRRSSQQNLMEQQRRTPLRSSSLLPSSGARYVTAAAAAAAAVASPNPTGSPLLRSPSFVQTAASSTQFEPAKSECQMTFPSVEKYSFGEYFPSIMFSSFFQSSIVRVILLGLIIQVVILLQPVQVLFALLVHWRTNCPVQRDI